MSVHRFAPFGRQGECHQFAGEESFVVEKKWQRRFFAQKV